MAHLIFEGGPLELWISPLGFLLLQSLSRLAAGVDCLSRIGLNLVGPLDRFDATPFMSAVGPRKAFSVPKGEPVQIGAAEFTVAAPAVLRDFKESQCDGLYDGGRD